MGRDAPVRRLAGLYRSREPESTTIGYQPPTCRPVPARSPWQSPYGERLIGSIRRECLDDVILLSERHLPRALEQYFAHSHRSRTHLALAKDAPEPRAVEPPDRGAVVVSPRSLGSTTDMPGGQPEVPSATTIALATRDRERLSDDLPMPASLCLAFADSHFRRYRVRRQHTPRATCRRGAPQSTKPTEFVAGTGMPELPVPTENLIRLAPQRLAHLPLRVLAHYNTPPHSQVDAPMSTRIVSWNPLRLLVAERVEQPDGG